MSCFRPTGPNDPIPPLKIGITGGIGSGKTTVCRMFMALGVPVFNSDSEARLLMEQDADLVGAIKSDFGSAVYHPDGHLDATYLAGKVFQDPASLHQLNALVHPVVQDAFHRWASIQNCRMVAEESALLFETGIFGTLDFNVLVTAPLEVCIERVIKRDGLSRTDVLKRMESQWPQEKKELRANAILHNDGRQPLIPQVMELFSQLQSF